MEPLILMGVVLLFAFMDAMTRGQRKQGGSDNASDGSDAPVDLEELTRRRRLERAQQLTRQRQQEKAEASRSSEGLVPQDVWEEITRLAQVGTAQPRPRPSRAERPPTQVARRNQRSPAPRANEIPSFEGPRTGEGAEIMARAEQALHRTHAQMGKRPALRTAAARPPIETLQSRNEELGAIRAMLSGGAPALRRAVVLEEILGPPAAMRGDPYEPTG